MDRAEMTTRVEILRARLERETDIVPLRDYACHEYAQRLVWETQARAARKTVTRLRVMLGVTVVMLLWWVVTS
jgi:hypothetical protein